MVPWSRRRRTQNEAFGHFSLSHWAEMILQMSLYFKTPRNLLQFHLASLNLKSASTSRLSLFFFVFWACSPQNYRKLAEHVVCCEDELALKEISCSPTHSRMDVCLKLWVWKPQRYQNLETNLRGLNVIVEVVAEGLDVRYNLIPSLASQVSCKED